MKRLLRIFLWLSSAVIALPVFALLYSTVKGYTTWYLRVDGVVSVDGRKTTGYLHADPQRSVLLITRTDGIRKETYLVPVADHAKIMDCGDWNPVRFLPMPLGDLSLPCSVFTDPAKVLDPSVPATLVRERRSLTFTTASGKKVNAEW